MSIKKTALLVLLAAGCVEKPKDQDKKAATAKAENKPGDNSVGGPPKPEGLPAPPDVAAPPADAQKDPKNGLAWKVLQKGTGDKHPGPEDIVTVNYTGWTTDGKMFDSSIPRKSPATFPLNRVIPGWTEGVQLMTEGEKVRFWIPVELAYNNRPGKPAGMLVFDVELLKIMK